MTAQHNENQGPSGEQQPGTRATAKWIIGLIGVLVILIVLVIFVRLEGEWRSTSSGDGAAQESSTQHAQTPESPPAAAAMQNTYELSGASNRSEPVELKRGAVTVEYSHRGTEDRRGGFFAISLLDDQGRYMRRLASGVGDADGSATAHIPRDGNYTLNVTAYRGEWTIRVR